MVGRYSAPFWPTIGAALPAKRHWVRVACDSCDGVTELDLQMKPRDPLNPISVVLRTCAAQDAMVMVVMHNRAGKISSKGSTMRHVRQFVAQFIAALGRLNTLIHEALKSPDEKSGKAIRGWQNRSAKSPADKLSEEILTTPSVQVRIAASAAAKALLHNFNLTGGVPEIVWGNAYLLGYISGFAAGAANAHGLKLGLSPSSLPDATSGLTEYILNEVAPKESQKTAIALSRAGAALNDPVHMRGFMTGHKVAFFGAGGPFEPNDPDFTLAASQIKLLDLGGMKTDTRSAVSGALISQTFSEIVSTLTGRNQINPANSSVSPKVQAALFVNRGKNYGVAGEFESALADFNEAIKLVPNDTDALYNRSLIYLMQNKFDAAITELDEAIKLEPKNADAFNNRGNAHYYLGQIDKAIADFDEAIKLNPSHIDAINNRKKILGH